MKLRPDSAIAIFWLKLRVRKFNSTSVLSEPRFFEEYSIFFFISLTRISSDASANSKIMIISSYNFVNFYVEAIYLQKKVYKSKPFKFPALKFPAIFGKPA